MRLLRKCAASHTSPLHEAGARAALPSTKRSGLVWQRIFDKWPSHIRSPLGARWNWRELDLPPVAAWTNWILASARGTKLRRQTSRTTVGTTEFSPRRVETEFAEPTTVRTRISCSLTFELSERQREDAGPGPAKMYSVPPARAWWPAVGAPLERGVRPQSHLPPAELRIQDTFSERKA